MKQHVKIGTRESELAVWQASLVKGLLHQTGSSADLVYIKSDGDVDTVTPLYELGVQGIFTKALDLALLSGRIDLAVHSMKDVPTQLAKGLVQAAVLTRGSFKDILVYKDNPEFCEEKYGVATIATSSIRRIAQWLHRYPNHEMVNLRGNVNTRLRKVGEHHWHGAIFAAAGVERIHLRPSNSIDLDWMLPAPAQGAIMVVCRENDKAILEACLGMNDMSTDRCTKIERDFLRTLLGGCSTPISALATEVAGSILFKGNICSTDGKELIAIEKVFDPSDNEAGVYVGKEMLTDPSAHRIINSIRNER